MGLCGCPRREMVVQGGFEGQERRIGTKRARIVETQALLCGRSWKRWLTSEGMAVW